MPGPLHAVTAGRFDLDEAEVSRLPALAGQPAFRSLQVWSALHQGLEPEEMTDVPLAVRGALAAALPAGLRLAHEAVSDRGTTIKWLWALADSTQVETVLMRYPKRATVCV